MPEAHHDSNTDHPGSKPYRKKDYHSKKTRIANNSNKASDAAPSSKTNDDVKKKKKKQEDGTVDGVERSTGNASARKKARNKNKNRRGGKNVDINNKPESSSSNNNIKLNVNSLNTTDKPVGEGKPLNKEKSKEKGKDMSNIKNKNNIMTRNKNKNKPNSNAKARTKFRNRNRRQDRARGIGGVEGYKLILRLLPPNLIETDFFQKIQAALDPHQDKDIITNNILEKYFVSGHYSSGIFDAPVYARAYYIFETMEILKKFAILVKDIHFVDDKDNATLAKLKISSYVKRFSNADVVGTYSSFEGSIEKDPLYKTFLKSLELFEGKDQESNEYVFQDFSMMRSLEKEKSKQHNVDELIAKQADDAITRLSSGIHVKSRSRYVGKPANETKKKPVETRRQRREAKRQKRIMKKLEPVKKAKNTDNIPKVNDASNVVILEAAGKDMLLARAAESKHKLKIKGARSIESSGW